MYFSIVMLRLLWFTIMLKISFINSILIEKDAISNALRDKIKAVDEYCCEKAIPYCLKIFVYSTDYNDKRIKIISNINQLVMDTHFLESDLIIYEYGIYHNIFDSIAIAYKKAKIVVDYHGITPPEFVSKEHCDVLNKSMDKRHNIFLADKVIVHGEYIKQDLLDIGIQPEKIFIVNLPVCFNYFDNSIQKIHKNKNIIYLLYVGRFVKHKGVIELLKAVKKLVDSGMTNIKLNLVGNLTYSDSMYIHQLREYIILNSLSSWVNFAGTVSDEELIEYYTLSDVLVIPSYHEGFCVPVAEAFFHGCYVIAYDSGNLPYIVNGLGRIVKTGDVDMLYSAIADYYKAKSSFIQGKTDTKLITDACNMSENEFISKARHYSNNFKFDHFKKSFIDVLDLELIRHNTEKSISSYSQAMKDLLKLLIKSSNDSCQSDELSVSNYDLSVEDKIRSLFR